MRDIRSGTTGNVRAQAMQRVLNSRSHAGGAVMLRQRSRPPQVGPQHLVQGLLDTIGFHGAAHPIRRLHHPGGMMAFPGGKPGFDEGLIARLNRHLAGKPPKIQPTFFDYHDGSVDLIPFVRGRDPIGGHDMNMHMGHPTFIDQGVSTLTGNNNHFAMLLKRFLTNPIGRRSNQASMLTHEMQKLYGVTGRRNN